MFLIFFVLTRRLKRPQHNKLHYVDVLEKMKTRLCRAKREKIGFRMSGARIYTSLFCDKVLPNLEIEFPLKYDV